MTPEGYAERYAEDWYTISPNYRTKEMLRHIIEIAVRAAVADATAYQAQVNR